MYVVVCDDHWWWIPYALYLHHAFLVTHSPATQFLRFAPPTNHPSHIHNMIPPLPHLWCQRHSAECLSWISTQVVVDIRPSEYHYLHIILYLHRPWRAAMVWVWVFRTRTRCMLHTILCRVCVFASCVCQFLMIRASADRNPAHAQTNIHTHTDRNPNAYNIIGKYTKFGTGRRATSSNAPTFDSLLEHIFKQISKTVNAKSETAQTHTWTNYIPNTHMFARWRREWADWRIDRNWIWGRQQHPSVFGLSSCIFV